MAPPAAARRISGLQRLVLSSYRECLSAVRRLPVPSRTPAAAFVRAEFRRHAAAVDKLDIQRVEHLLRHARKQVERAATVDSYAPAGIAVRPGTVDAALRIIARGT